MTKKVLVFGGGISGLTAAHELLVRGFQVEIYEASATFGGLAQTQWHTHTEGGKTLELPGEHGFRLFPSFYRHVTDSMARTPVEKGSERSVFECLRPTRVQGVAYAGDGLQAIRFSRTLPRSVEAIARGITSTLSEMRLEPADISRFQLKMLQYMTSCAERRLGEYEKKSWWDYLEGDRFTPRFQRYLKSVPRALVAMDALRCDGRTQSNVLVQHLLDHLSKGTSVDRVLDGPTSRRWIEPWVRHLKDDLGARAFERTALRALRSDGCGTLTEVLVEDLARAETRAITDFDFVVLAVPLGALQGLLTPALAEEDLLYGNRENPSLRQALDYPLRASSAILSGIQFYLRDDASILPGHVFLPDSEWGLSLVSQAQFWGDDFARRYGGGVFDGILSVDVANFDEEAPIRLEDGSVIRRRARDCTDAEFARGVWQQIQRSFDAPPEVQRSTVEVFDDDRLELREWRLPVEMPPYHVDDLLRLGAPRSDAEVMITPPNSFARRPGPVPRYGVHLGKVVLAGTFMQTFTGLPTMECAGESGRHAVNAILESLDSLAERCPIWPIEGAEPRDLDGLKDLDRELYRRGEPHWMEIIELERLLAPFMSPPTSPELDAWTRRLFPGRTEEAPPRAKRRARTPDPLSDTFAVVSQLFRMGAR